MNDCSSRRVRGDPRPDMTIEALVAKYGLFALFLGAGIEGVTAEIAAPFLGD